MTQLNFLYTQVQLQEIADAIIKQSLKLGASNAQVELSESISTDVEVLNQNIENFETSHENQLLLTVFKGHKKGNVGISSLSNLNLEQIIQQALDIATFTQDDDCNGILEKEFQAKPLKKDLELYNPINISNDRIIQESKELEELALNAANIKASEGSATTLTHYNFVTANSNGFNDGYMTSRYSKYVSLIGENKSNMQNDYWYSSSRDYNTLDSNSKIATLAQNRLNRRLITTEYSSCKPYVIFETQIAKSIIGSLMGAISGNSLYRQLSFLNDSLQQKILPKWITITEDPFIKKGLSSCYFDNEGGKVAAKDIIANGIIQSYLLTGYTARKLAMQPTGNSGGNHNLTVTNNFNGGIEKLATQITDGIIIIDTIGHGLNMVTGDYSVGASGLVIKNGLITGFVDNLTISGNMRDIFNGISLISDDYHFSSINCGSMLIDKGIIQVSAKQ